MTCTHAHLEFTMDAGVYNVTGSTETDHQVQVVTIRGRCKDCGGNVQFTGLPQGEVSHRWPTAAYITHEAQMPFTVTDGAITIAAEKAVADWQSLNFSVDEPEKDAP